MSVCGNSERDLNFDVDFDTFLVFWGSRGDLGASQALLFEEGLLEVRFMTESDVQKAASLASCSSAAPGESHQCRFGHCVDVFLESRGCVWEQKMQKSVMCEFDATLQRNRYSERSWRFRWSILR